MIILTLILVNLEPSLNSEQKHNATQIPPPPPLSVANENITFETTTTQTTMLQETPTNVLIEVDRVSNDCKLMVNEDEELSDDELRRRVEEFLDKVNRGWKAKKLSLSLCS
ncbi:hypothetical protein QVD17_37962 [Tagetes erecta]|uniref:Uncharacterized protein n=1 Tax=Tagetes erecta TaxID=13708 RepID=A0AAD8JX23_TARER|nr:hypothetical protein QVD17_37962 [Tagetes erecta]